MFKRVFPAAVVWLLALTSAESLAVDIANLDYPESVAICTESLEQALALELETFVDEIAAGNSSGESGDSLDGDDTDGLPLSERLIGVVCKEQVDSVLAHPWAALLERERGDLRLQDLEAFYQQLHHYQRRVPGAPLAESDLVAVLALMDEPEEDPISLWERVLKLFYQWWNTGEEVDTDWLEQLIPSEEVLKIVFYACVAIILVLAAVIIWGEARVALRYRRDTGGTGWDVAHAPQPDALTLDAVRLAALTDQPGLLLRWLLGQLEAAGLGAWRSSQTHRDIVTMAASLPQEQGGALSQLSEAAERATYGGWVPAPADLEALFAQCGRAVTTLKEPHRA